MDDVGLTVLETDWGWMGLASSPRGLVEVRFPQPSEEAAWRELRETWPEADLLPDEALTGLKDKLRRFFAGEPICFADDFQLDCPPGRPFHRKVWEVVASIPYGETRTYGQVAAEAGRPRAARAVGAAMATNPWPVVVPCHRVVGSGGSLTGFGGGLGLKSRLLEMERRAKAGE